MRKWNYDTMSFEPFEPPDGGQGYEDTPLSEVEDNTRCACCGQLIDFPFVERSTDIVNNNGDGYKICFPCWWREQQAFDEWLKKTGLRRRGFGFEKELEIRNGYGLLSKKERKSLANGEHR